MKPLTMSPTTLTRILLCTTAALLLASTSALADPQDGDRDHRGWDSSHDRGDHSRPTPPTPQQPQPQPQPQAARPTPMSPYAMTRHDDHRNDHRDDHDNRNDNNNRWDNHRDDHRNNDWRSRDDHKSRSNTNISVNFGSSYRPAPVYYPPAPRYVPTSYGHRIYPQYYRSNYYTQRYIPVEPEVPYVEVQCGSQPITGTIVGGVAGGLIGNQFGHGSGRTAATVGGALLGVILGQSIDQANESCAYQALEYAQPNTQVVWADPNDSYSYTVTPGPVTTLSDGRYCREYQAKILVGNQLQDGYGTACRQPDGSWEVIN